MSLPDVSYSRRKTREVHVGENVIVGEIWSWSSP